MKKFKEFLKKTKENAPDFIKFFLLDFVMTVGFWFIYLWIWCWVGLPLTTWAICLVAFLAGITQYLYYRWLSK
jgi:hypothetical protein